jgi:hypothetical protein
MAHNQKWHGKLGGNHTSVIEAAWRFLPGVIAEQSVKMISPGFIKAGKNSTGRNSVKIINEKSCILLSVRGASAHQEIRVYAHDIQKAKSAIAQSAKNASFHVSFMDRS